MTADGAYDGETVYDAVAERHPKAAVIIPPRATAVPNELATTQRDRHIAVIEEHGRMGWQRRSGYNRRSLVETAMYRYKTAGGFTPGGKDWLQRAQPDNHARHAGHRPDPLIRAARRETQPAIYSCTKALYCRPHRVQVEIVSGDRLHALVFQPLRAVVDAVDGGPDLVAFLQQLLDRVPACVTRRAGD